MLERIQNQPQKTPGDSLDNAIFWKIPIYPLNKFLGWLEKVNKSIDKSQEVVVGRGVRELTGIYLKLETTSRPEFKQFNVWPKLGIHTINHNHHKKNHKQENKNAQRMTRKVNRTVKEASSAPGGGNGYCEMCRIHYDQLDSHVVSVQHTKLATDSNQYTNLDSLISQHNLGSNSLRKSLRIAKSPPPYLPPEMGSKQSSESPAAMPRLNGHITRSVSAKSADKFHLPIFQPLVNLGTPVPFSSPVALYNGLDLRSRSKTPTTKQEDSSSDDKPVRCVRTSTEKNHKIKDEFCVPDKILRSRERRNCTLSSPEKRARDKCKKSDSSLDRSKRLETPTKEKISKLVTKNERRKNSPKSEERSSARLKLKSSPAPAPVRAPTDNKVRPRRSVTIVPVQTKTTHTSTNNKKMIKKRLSVEEKFIEDNKSYYKVEVLNSKLRSTEHFKQVEERVAVNGTKPKSSSDDIKPVVVRFKKVRKSELAVLSDEAENFMFKDLKREPVKSEPQESTSQKKEEKKIDEEEKKSIKKKKKKPEIVVKQEVIDPVEDYQEVETIDYSFEMNWKVPAWREARKRQKESKEFYTTQYHSYPKAILPYEVFNDRKTYKRKDRFGRLQQLIDDRPRKSPRCHASTLAIMSSLISRRRPHRECNDKPINYDEESSLTETIVSSGSNSSVPRCRVAEVIASACAEPVGDKIASALLSGSKKVDLEPGECLGVDPSCLTDTDEPLTGLPGPKMDMNLILSSYQDCKALEIDDYPPPHFRYFDGVRNSALDSCASSDCSDRFSLLDDGRGGLIKKKKKRRRNLTGWPERPKRRKETSLPILYPEVEPSSPASSSITPVKKKGRPRKYPLALPTPVLAPQTPPPSPLTMVNDQPPILEEEKEFSTPPKKRKLPRTYQRIK